MTISRRSFLGLAGVAGVAGAGALLGRPRRALAAGRPAVPQTPAMLVDTTKCVGCRGCEAACSEANKLPPPADAGKAEVFDRFRVTDTKTFTVVNRAVKGQGDKPSTYIKTQCMHCVEPACASACLAKALRKSPEGPVIYKHTVCIGCRYCMIACPYEIPKFEYEKPLPYIRKCEFCYERQKQGLKPACASVCPSGALTFGTRHEMLELARTRIYQNPDKYVHHIYGEHEVGGTGILYIGNVAFEQLGLKSNVGEKSYAQLTSAALAVPPMVLTIGAPLLMGLYAVARSRSRDEHTDEHGGTKHE
jgi:Fe-S-cluster-containing dehydrogenase component